MRLLLPLLLLVAGGASDPAAVVKAYRAAADREAALALLGPDFHLRFDDGPGIAKESVATMLRWDFALHPEHVADTMTIDGNTVTIADRETNDFARLIDFPGWRSTQTFVVGDDGLIHEQRYAAAADNEKWQPYLERALPWLREHRAAQLARIYPDGKLRQTSESAREWVSVLCDWRAASGREAVKVCKGDR